MRATLSLFAVTLAASAPVLAAQPIAVSSFNAVELRGGGEVQVRPGPVQRVTLIDGSSQFTTIRVVRNGKLRIDTCNARCPHRYRMRILIESPTVPVLGVSGGGSIVAQSGFGNQRDLTVAVGGGGEI